MCDSPPTVAIVITASLLFCGSPLLKGSSVSGVFGRLWGQYWLMRVPTKFFINLRIGNSRLVRKWVNLNKELLKIWASNDLEPGFAQFQG